MTEYKFFGWIIYITPHYTILLVLQFDWSSAHIIVQQLNCFTVCFTVFTSVFRYFWQRFSNYFWGLQCYASRCRQATVFMSHLSHLLNGLVQKIIHLRTYQAIAMSESFESLTKQNGSKTWWFSKWHEWVFWIIDPTDSFKNKFIQVWTARASQQWLCLE